jgi:hypothetical protein
MDGFGIHLLCRRDDGVNLQITLARRSWSNPNCFIRHTHMHTLDVSVGIDRNGANAQLATGANDANSDFASIGNQDFAKHGKP